MENEPAGYLKETVDAIVQALREQLPRVDSAAIKERARQREELGFWDERAPWPPSWELEINDWVAETQPVPSFERVEACAHGWNTQYPEHWRARRESEGYTPAEIRDAIALAWGRLEMYSSLCQSYGRPEYGGGGYSNTRVYDEILKAIEAPRSIFGPLPPGHPYIKAAEIIRRREAK